MKPPIKRHKSLTPLSQEHHHGLLLCWKIRTGFKKNIEVGRIKHYADWFYKNHLAPHFEVEERYVFSVLGNEHDLVRRALADHRRLRKLFEGTDNISKNLGIIEEKLDAHIRFEERVLFDEIQKVASPAELEEILAKHSSQSEIACPEWEDEFWK